MKLSLTLVNKNLLNAVSNYISDFPQYGHHIKFPVGYSFERVEKELSLDPNSKNFTLYSIDIEGVVSGACYFNLDKQRKSATIAISIDAGKREHGVGSQTLQKLVEILNQQHPEISYVETYVCCKNIASIKGLSSAGFDIAYIERLGFIRENIIADGIQFAFKLYRPIAQDLYSHKSMLDPQAELKRLDTQSKASYVVEDRFFKSLVEENDVKSILDLGCGTGAFLRGIFGEKPADVTLCGVDISEDFIKFAQQEHSAGEYFASDIEDFLKNTDRKFDLITSRYVLTHLPKDKIERVLELVQSRLTDKGVFYFVTLDAEGYQTLPRTPLQELILKHKETVRWKNNGYWRISPSMPLLLRKSGLSLDKIEHLFLDTDRHVSKEIFARSLGGQLIWAIDEDWKPIALAAQTELNEWSQREDSFGSVQVHAWVGRKK